jgi:uracil-DNA glycosylase
MNDRQKNEQLNQLRKRVASCRKCALYKTRKHIVLGDGDRLSGLMFVGEAPGANEDRLGKPFVGRAGKIFDELLASVGLDRNKIYLCNVLKCRPPKNRKPTPEEIEACGKMLDRQIRIVNPRIIGTMGTFATNVIFQKYGLPPAAISAVAGHIFSVGDTQIIPVFHPAVAIYNKRKKPLMIKHFQMFRTFLA